METFSGPVWDKIDDALGLPLWLAGVSRTPNQTPILFSTTISLCKVNEAYGDDHYPVVKLMFPLNRSNERQTERLRAKMDALPYKKQTTPMYPSVAPGN